MAITNGFGPKFYPWKASSGYGKVIPDPFRSDFVITFVICVPQQPPLR